MSRNRPDGVSHGVIVLCCLLYQCSCEHDKVSARSRAQIYYSTNAVCVSLHVCGFVIARVYESRMLPLWYMVYLAVRHDRTESYICVSVQPIGVAMVRIELQIDTC
jgi:hypothetical protein